LLLLLFRQFLVTILGNWARRRSILDNGAVLGELKATTAGEGEMEGSSGPSKWMWLASLSIPRLISPG
jgi:hypothetical protein